MIEYFNVASTTVVLTIVVLLRAVWTQRLDLERICQKIEPLKDVFQFLCKLPNWLNYYNDLHDNLEKLNERRDTLHSRERDVLGDVQREESSSRGERKQEVGDWLKDATSKRGDVRIILNNLEIFPERNCLLNFIYHAWFGNCIEKLIREIDELLVQRSSFLRNGPLVHSAGKKNPLLPPKLVGRRTLDFVEEIVEWVRNEEDSRQIFGVHGEEGVGKSALMIEIYNQLIWTFDVYRVCINGEKSITVKTLQRKIAKELSVKDLNDEDETRRAATLYNVLRKMDRFVLILDGLCEQVDLGKVGIPIHLNGDIKQSRGKLMITTRNRVVCRTMACGKTILLEPLSDEEAEQLFDRELVNTPCTHPDIGLIKRKIIRKCHNIPGKVKNAAQELIGENDFDKWKIKLDSM